MSAVEHALSSMAEGPQLGFLLVGTDRFSNSRVEV